MTGPPKRPDIVRLWVEKAEHDLLNIDNNLTASHVPWDTVCFHAQQGAEKYLKALLTQYGVAFPKIHDLTELVALLPVGARPALPPGILEALQGATVEEAMANLREAAELFLECTDPEELQLRLHTEVFVTRFEATHG